MQSNDGLRTDVLPRANENLRTSWDIKHNLRAGSRTTQHIPVSGHPTIKQIYPRKPPAGAVCLRVYSRLRKNVDLSARLLSGISFVHRGEIDVTDMHPTGKAKTSITNDFTFCCLF